MRSKIKTRSAGPMAGLRLKAVREAKAIVTDMKHNPTLAFSPVVMRTLLEDIEGKLGYALYGLTRKHGKENAR